MIKAWFLDINSSGSPLNNYIDEYKTYAKILNFNSYFSNSRIELKLINSEERPCKSDKNIFLIELYNSELANFNSFNFNPLNKLSKVSIDWLKDNPFVKIVILESYESKTILKEDNPVIPSIELFRITNKLQNKIILQNCCYNYQEYKKTTKRYIPDWLTVLGKADFTQNNLNLPETFKDNKQLPTEKFLDSSNFKYKFITYNGRGRLSRLLLLTKSFESFNEKSFLYSYRGKEVSDGVEWMLENEESTNYTLTNEEVLKLKTFHEKSPIYNLPSTVNKDRSNLKYMHLPNPVDYESVFIEVIGETLSWRESIRGDKGKSTMLFLTEKTLKPMLAYRPFLISANPGHLRMVKELGFKTFENWFDESYDNQMTLKENIEIIHTNLKKVYSWSNEELNLKFNEMRPILEHNRKKAYNYIFNQEKTWVKELIEKW